MSTKSFEEAVSSLKAKAKDQEKAKAIVGEKAIGVIGENPTTIFDIEGKFLHVKVGNDKLAEDGEALRAEIEKVEKQISTLIDGNNVNCLVFVTHYAVDVQVVESKK